MHFLGFLSFGVLKLLTVFTIFAFSIFTQAQQTALPTIIAPATNTPKSTWAKFEKLFIFGDSWSNTEFNWKGAQPSISSPLGNPNYTLTTNGARWPVHLTIAFNASLLETYCLAQVGGVIDSSITPHGSDFVHQIKENFLPTYGNSSSGNWTATSTLFIAYFGVNDVNLVLPLLTPNSYLDRIFASYEHSIVQLYEAGARNLLLMNEPPMDLAPGALPGLKPVISDYNTRLTALIQTLAQKYHSSTPSTSMNIVEFDTHSLFTSVIANPASNPETVQIKNTTGWCPAYYNKGPHPADFHDPSCGASNLGEYLWLNAIHPTITMYRAMAAEIAKTFGG